MCGRGWRGGGNGLNGFTDGGSDGGGIQGSGDSDGDIGKERREVGVDSTRLALNAPWLTTSGSTARLTDCRSMATTGGAQRKNIPVPGEAPELVQKGK